MASRTCWLAWAPRWSPRWSCSGKARPGATSSRWATCRSSRRRQGPDASVVWRVEGQVVSSDAKERIRERLPIAEVIGEVVSLKPAGRGRLKGLCPFHNEKTPSFHVHLDRGFYYCFGCHAKGDVFDFVMQTQSLSFGDALRLLGARVGIEVSPAAPEAGKRRDLLDVNKRANAFFRSQLGSRATGYLLGRGLAKET